METKKAVIFGAGNIGRGFLGDLLGRSGYAIHFVDVDAEKVAALNRERRYKVTAVSSAGKREYLVDNVAASLFQDEDHLASAITDADLILTAVGKNALPYVAQTLPRLLLHRLDKRPRDECATIVIACENIQDNTSYLRMMMSEKLPAEDWKEIERIISFPNCVVDRIVPNLKNDSEDHLAVTVEDYFQFVVDRTSLHGPFPNIVGITVSGNLNSTLEQKLFTLNMAHAIVAYFGYMSGYTKIHEAVQDASIKQLMLGALDEVSLLITQRNHTISILEQQAYADKITKRFENPSLQDEITRVARDPKRKLGSSDRLVGPARGLCELGRTPAYLSTGIAAAFHYDYDYDPEAKEITTAIQQLGIDKVMDTISGLATNQDLARLVKSSYFFREL